MFMTAVFAVVSPPLQALICAANGVLVDPPDARPRSDCTGELHKRYLREHRPILYSKPLLSEKLYPVCREIDSAAGSRRKLGMSHDEIVRELVCE